jgi:hypothetical protein
VQEKILTTENLQKGMASPRSLCVVQWPFRNMLTSITTLSVCQGGMEPNPNMGALWHSVDTVRPGPRSLWSMVGGDCVQGHQRRQKALQWFGDLHMLESLEGEKLANIQ